MSRRHVWLKDNELNTEKMNRLQNISRQKGARFASTAFVTGSLDIGKNNKLWIKSAQRIKERTTIIIPKDSPKNSLSEMVALSHNCKNKFYIRGRLGCHEEFGEEILALAHRSSKNGEPIVKPMAWFWPDAGYETIQDQFILGDNLLVAPVLEKDARTRKVVFPVGTWVGDDGSEVVGPATVEIAAPLERLPYFRLQVSK